MSRVGYHVGVVALLWGLHVWWQVSLFSILPFVITGPLFLSWTLQRPFVVLLIFSQVAELLTLMPPGVVTAAVLLPWLIRRLLFGIQPGWKMTFGAALVFSTVGAVALLMSPDIFTYGVYGLPWLVMGYIVFFTVAIVGGLCVVGRELWAIPERA